MSRWFRHYAGMVRDDKLVRAALKSRQTVERVVWVWGAILESAAELDDGGRYELDHAEVAYFLRADEDDIARIEVALCDLGRLHEGAVARWATRQFQSDRSAERTKRYRDRRRGDSDGEPGPSRDDDVTSQERHGDSPETETETETEEDKSSEANASGAVAPSALASPKDRVWAAAPEIAARANRAESTIKSFFGKCLAEFDPDVVEKAILAAIAEGSGDPCGFITRVLKPAQGRARASPYATANSYEDFDPEAIKRNLSRNHEPAGRIQ